MDLKDGDYIKIKRGTRVDYLQIKYIIGNFYITGIKVDKIELEPIYTKWSNIIKIDCNIDDVIEKISIKA